MTCFAPTLLPRGAAAQDPTKHVNYVLGMVLGVDDLTQEFGYLSQRDQWMVRDLDGYGTVWGLAVSLRDPTPRGPEIVVAPGVAVNPRGQLIRVAPTQCAALNDWLAGKGPDILARRIPTANPNLFQLPAYVVLSYRTCLTDPVPIAGEPCRSEDDSTAPSRAADDFLLELRFDPPPQQEEDSVRELVSWLRAHLDVTSGGAASLTVAQFLDVIRAAAKNAQQAVTSPPSPPGPGEFLLDGSPPVVLSVPAAQLADYLRAIARLYVTELRPMWRPNWLGVKHGASGSDLLAAPDEGNAVLLAKLTLTIGPDGLNSAVWKVQGATQVDEDARPFLLQTRLYEELAIQAGGAAATGPNAPVLVAAGQIAVDGAANARASFGNLRLSGPPIAGAAGLLTVAFDNYAVPPAAGGPQYIVKVTPVAKTADVSVAVASYPADGIQLAVRSATTLTGALLMIEVSRIG